MVGGIAHLVAAFRVHLRNREEGISGAKKKERKARYITTVCLAPWHATAEPGRWGSAPHRNSRRPVKLEDLSGKMWQVISGLKMLQAGMHLHWSFCGFLTVPPQNLAMRSWRGDKSCYPKIWRPARPRNACWNRWTRCQADSTWEWRAPIGTPLPLKPQNASKCPTLSWCDASWVQCPCVIRKVSLPTQTQQAWHHGDFHPFLQHDPSQCRIRSLERNNATSNSCCCSSSFQSILYHPYWSPAIRDSTAVRLSHAAWQSEIHLTIVLYFFA